MSDPFSILAAAAGLTDVCIRFAIFLKDSKDGYSKLGEDIDKLHAEIQSFTNIIALVGQSYEHGRLEMINPNDRLAFRNHWNTTQSTLVSCTEIVEDMKEWVDKILRTPYGKLGQFFSYQYKGRSLKEMRDSLMDHQAALNTGVAAVNLIYGRSSHLKSSSMLTQITTSVANLDSKIKSQMAVLESNREGLNQVLKASRTTQVVVSVNKHFYVPQTVSSIFSGRSEELDVLKEHIGVSSPTQRRFVVYGPPGSGKTQFCCKFASDTRQMFWGVFWIDATSKDSVTESFSSIADVGKVASNDRAAKNWISTAGGDSRWLLIIDNADDENMQIEQHFPDGMKGTILITTRNPTLKIHGTIGDGYYNFNELDDKDSVNLLLKAAAIPMPWSPTTMSIAKEICQTLGNSPLVLLHAGKTVSARLCKLENYLDIFERNMARIRQMRTSEDGQLISHEFAAIYSSYELVHESILAKGTQASRDALILLRVLAFFNRKGIRLAIFRSAASNPSLEAKHKQQEQHEANRRNLRRSLTWLQTLKQIGIGLFISLNELSTQSLIPAMLYTDPKSGLFDDFRLLQALKELYQKSLIIAESGSDDDSYSIHPAVHLWLRQRPEMTLREQAVYCQIAADILSQAVLLPPLGKKKEDEILLRDLLPHVSHVQRCEQAILTEFQKNRESRRLCWPNLDPRLDRQRALQLVKFSLVLAHGGRLEEAATLQICVKDFALKYLGIEHERTMDIILLLSKTYWDLAKGDDAADLQKKVLDACIATRGKNDLKTLRVMDMYGSSRWVCGEIIDAKNLHRAAYEGFQRLLGDDEVDTLKALCNLGRDISKDFEFTEAINLLTKAYTGLQEKLPNSQDTVNCKDCLAMAYYDRAAFGYGTPEDLDIALRMEQEVFDYRKDSLGRENVYTLWSGVNLARIKAAQGKANEALSIFLEGHVIARRNLEKTDFRRLFGKIHWARILMAAGKHTEAEKKLTKVINAYEGRRRRHPDRLIALYSLIKCREMLGKLDEMTTRLAKELTESVIILYGPKHPSVKYFLKSQNLWKEFESDLMVDYPSDGELNSPVERAYPTEKPVPQKTDHIAQYGHI